jgi:hydrogenase-4 component B
MGLLISSSILSIAGAVLALLAGRSESTAKILGCMFGLLAAVLALASGISAMFGPVSTFGFGTAFFAFSLRLDPLAGIMISVISMLALTAWIYGFSYFDDYRGKGIGSMCFFMNSFIASMNGVIAVDNVFWFLVFFELMSLTSYFLVVTEQDDAAIKGGFMYFVMAHMGFFMIMISFLIMASVTGSFEFAAFRATRFAPAVASTCFLLAFLGFGFKAGMVPFHSWLPMAHPAAPSNVSALMSGGMIKIGVFGIVKVAFDLLGASGSQLWWGIVVLLFGAVSSILGVAYALNEHDIKRLLAYHSVENIGIILLGVGVALVGSAVASPVITVIGLLAGLFHLINHAMFKGLLFLGAGSVLYSTGTRNMEALGGLRKVMPTTAICFLIGSLAISAIPPLNGFVSEWFTYQGLITAAMGGGAVIKLVCAFGAVMLAITGALAVTCFVKAYGVTFLGDARSERARAAREVPAPMRTAMVLLAVICIALGICAPVVVPVLVNAAAVTAGQAAVDAATGLMLVNPAIDSTISTPLLAVLLLAAVFVPWGIIKARSRGGVSYEPDPWACGYLPTSDMPLVANSVGAQVRHFWRPLYTIRDSLSARSPVFAAMFRGLSRWADAAQNWGDIALVNPTGKVVTWLGEKSSKLEGGDYRVYIMYVVVALVVFLALAVTLV